MKILQFGGGNFLRCFLDWMLQKIENETGLKYEVTLVQLTDGEPVFEIAAAGSYHVMLRGYEGDRYTETLDEISVIKNAVSPMLDVSKYLEEGCGDIGLIVSNSTEAGIFFDAAHKTPHNYPSFLAMLLNERAKKKLLPVMIMAMELNDRSGDLLKTTLANYGKSFNYSETYFNYLENCKFYNTLVDRIVPGYPADAAERVFEQIGRRDPWLTSGERFHLFVIEGDESIMEHIPFDRGGLNVIVTRDKLDFYHDRKVRILNGAHTSSVPVALLAGIEDVSDFASHCIYSKWLSRLMHDEICFSIDDSPETHGYADEVLIRFKNPSLGHKFRSIALNTVAKANTRMSPTLRDYYSKTGSVAPIMTEAAGKLCELYETGAVAKLPGGPLELNDHAQIRGSSIEEMLGDFFPSLPGYVRRAMLDEITGRNNPSRKG